MRNPEEERRIISPLKHFLMQSNLEALVEYLNDTKASWGISRPFNINDRKQSQVYRARIQVYGSFEHKASGDTAKSALCNALASFFAHEMNDYHLSYQNVKSDEEIVCGTFSGRISANK